MRRLCFYVALLLALALQPSAASAGSTYKDFVAAWTERDARYVEQHAALDKQAREATTEFLAKADPNSSESGSRLQRMITAIKAASLLDGRGAMLRDLRIHMEKKPAAASTELWMQERTDAVRTQAAAVAAKFAELRGMNERGLGESDEYFQNTVAALIMASTLEGKVQELSLLDQNLSSYFRAKGQEDAERREARARIFGAIGASLTAYSNNANRPWTATCTTSGNRTNCSGF